MGIAVAGEATIGLMEYNGYNQPVKSVEGGVSTDYAYRPDGFRYSKATDGATTKHIWDGQDIIADTSPVGVSKYTRGINLLSREYQRGAEAGGTTETVVETYLFNAHGDVVQLADTAGKITKDYEYDAFGNPPAEPADNGEGGETEEPDEEGIGAGTAPEAEGSNQGYQDTNPFRYAGEYLNLSSGMYYLRARYYQPTTGRFLTEDTHWNPQNSIYGDNPVQIGEHKTPLGLNIYTYRPDINAICQSTNSYIYSMNNPIMYRDTNGKFVITTATLLIIGGAALVGTIGGFVGNYIADQKGATDWDKAGYIAGGAVIGGTVGAIVGGVAAPAAVSATGVAGFSVSTTGISTVAVAGSALTIPEYVKNAGSFISWTQQAFEKTQQEMNLQQVQQLFDQANKYGVKISADLSGHVNTNWPMAHIHFGDARVHIAVAKEAIEWIMKNL